ncbi:DUF3349 domain-containing protein [Mycobacterium tilburgii]|uniref:DUF3349 domain-containing protein n=1 Tax=Mycobacterium tilburgii TaxID=44467 RepID=UPI001181C787
MSRTVAFLREGCPSEMPATGYVPMASLLPRRISNAEIASLTSELDGHDARVRR